MILNLKQMNKNVEYYYFKLETLSIFLALVTPIVCGFFGLFVFLFVWGFCLFFVVFFLFVFFCSLDRKDAFFSVHANESSQKCLIFSGKARSTLFFFFFFFFLLFQMDLPVAPDYSQNC